MPASPGPGGQGLDGARGGEAARALLLQSRASAGPVSRPGRRGDPHEPARQDAAAEHPDQPAQPRQVEVALDLDGTILDLYHHKPYTKLVRETITAVQDAGIPVTIVTGRTLDYVRKHVAPLGITTPVVTTQGAVIGNPVTGEILSETTIPIETARRVTAFIDSQPYITSLYFLDPSGQTKIYQNRVGHEQEFYDHVFSNPREIYEPLLRSHGLDPNENPVRFNWGIPEKPRIELEDINRFYATPPHVEPALSRDEVRRMLRSLGFPIMVEERGVEGCEVKPRIIEAQNSIIVQPVKPDEIDLGSLKDLVIDSEKGVRLTLADDSQSRRIIAITFDKRKWSGWNRKTVKRWLDENLQLIEEKICRREMRGGG